MILAVMIVAFLPFSYFAPFCSGCCGRQCCCMKASFPFLEALISTGHVLSQLAMAFVSGFMFT